MRLLGLLALAIVFAANGHAARTTSPEQCLRKTTEDTIAFQRTIMKMAVRVEIRKRGMMSQKEAIVKLVEEIFQDVAVASREMSKSTNAKDLAPYKRDALNILDSKAPHWTVKMERILENFPDTPEARKAKAADMTASCLSLGEKTVLSSIEEAAQDCF